MSDSKTIDCIGVGSPMMDVIAQVDEVFLAGVDGAKGGMELVEADAMEDVVGRLTSKPIMTAGGSAANTTFGLTRLGTKTAFLGKLGDDDMGHLYRTQFEAAGVNGTRFKLCDTTPTGRCLCLVTPDSERTMRTCLGAAMTLSPDEITADDFADARHVHIEGYVLFNRDLALHVLKTAKAAGCTVSVDLASFEVVHANRDILDELLSTYVDIVFANEDESMAFTETKDPKDGLEQLGALCDTVAVKLGPDGAWLKHKDNVVRIKANPVKAIDTTGAGDLWASGFLHGWLRGDDLETCGMHGAITGAEVVQVLGAAITDETWESILDRINSPVS